MAELIRTTQGTLVGIDGAFSMWTDYDLEVRGDQTIDYDLLLEVRFDRAQDRTQLRALKVLQRAEGPDVSGTGLRTLRLQDYVRATRVEVSQRTESGDLQFENFDRLIARDRWDEATWKQMRLRWVYRIYRTAQLALRDPALEVQQRLDLPPSTGTRWIREARDAGIFVSEQTTVEHLGDIGAVGQVSRISDGRLHGDG